LTEGHVRVLHHIHFLGRVVESQLRSDVVIGARANRLLKELMEADLVRRSGKGSFRVAPDAFALRRIVAVEAKVGRWAQAIEQAITNTWFASHSYVLFPERLCPADASSMAVAEGIGLIVVNEDRAKILVRSPKHRLPDSYASWLFNEWTLQAIWANAEGRGVQRR